MTSTKRTILSAAAGLTLALAAPVFAGSTSMPFLPSLQFAEQPETVTKADTSPAAPCTRLERAAKLDPSQCGTLSRKEVRALKNAQEN
jgi:hypothetical protein